MVIHPLASVTASAQIAPGCVVLAGAVVNANASLYAGVLVNTGAWLVSEQVARKRVACGLWVLLWLRLSGL